MVHTHKLSNVIHMSAASILFYDCRRYVIGLYRENAIAIQNESGDSKGGNV